MDQSRKSQSAKIQHFSTDLADTGFRTTLFFNRFGMESSDTHVVLHFGYIARNGDVLGYYSTALPKSFLDANREDWLEYMGKVGNVPDRAMDVSWRPPVGQSRQIEMTNAIRMGRVGADAELRFYVTSIVSMIEKQRTGTGTSKPLQSQPLALLQSSLEQQQLLLLALVKYKDL